jgi:hypothetical protein
VLDLSTGDRLVVQPRFTGALLVDAGALDARERRFLRVTLDLADGRGAALPRHPLPRHGRADGRRTRFAEYAGALGRSLLTPPSRRRIYRPRSGLAPGGEEAPDGPAPRSSGVGNIYANEALWRAGSPGARRRVAPPREVRGCATRCVDVLDESIALRGTSFRDYVDGRGERGRFVRAPRGVRRAGRPCQRCARAADAEIDGRDGLRRVSDVSALRAAACQDRQWTPRSRAAQLRAHRCSPPGHRHPHARSVPIDAHLPSSARTCAPARDRPGVYRMLGRRGEVSYVGKSKRVRTRLLSYFRARTRREGRAHRPRGGDDRVGVRAERVRRARWSSG